MIKQVILIVALSFVAIFFKTQLNHMLTVMIYIHNYIAILLHRVFSDDVIGRIIQDMISLLIIPFIGGFIITASFWLVKRAAMPHTMGLVWVVWLVLAVTMIAQTGISVGNDGHTQVAQVNH